MVRDTDQFERVDILFAFDLAKGFTQFLGGKCTGAQVIVIRNSYHPCQQDGFGRGDAARYKQGIMEVAPMEDGDEDFAEHVSLERSVHFVPFLSSGSICCS